MVRFSKVALAFGTFLIATAAFADPNACRLAADASAALGGSDAFSRALGRGPLYAGLAAFVGGLAVSLTPCVYPMIAVTVSVFGARAAQSRAQGFVLSAAYVLGIIAMFVPAGVVAGMTGGMFGALLQHRAVLVAVSTIFLGLAASMFGVFEFTLPSGLMSRLTRVGGIGLKGAFGLGLVSGLIAAPCTGPVLTGILLWIARTQNPWLGGAAMAAFGLGLGVPFFIVGTFAVQLPKSGRWMLHVKSGLGLLLVIVALYFLSSAFPGLAAFATRTPTFLGAMAALTVGGLALGAVHRSFEAPGLGNRMAKSAGILAAGFGGALLLLGLGKPAGSLAWEPSDFEAARAKARAAGRPLLVDFTASWCEACKKLDRSTFAEPRVAAEAGRFVAVKVDATDAEDDRVDRIKRDLGVVGLPTVLLFDSSGKEAARCTDFVPAEAFLPVLSAVR
jgi:thiol:disulfide interchange protein DsbD